MKSIAFIPMTENFDLERFSSMISKAVQQKSTILTSKNICRSNDYLAHATDGSALYKTLINALENLENQSSIAIYIADNHNSGWTNRCISRTEQAILVGDYEMEHITEAGKMCLMNQLQMDMKIVFEYPNKNVLKEEKINFLTPSHIHKQYHLTAFNFSDIEILAKDIQIDRVASLEVLKAA